MTPQQSGRDLVVTIRVNVGLHRDIVAYNPLDRESTSVYFRLYSFDNHTPTIHYGALLIHSSAHLLPSFDVIDKSRVASCKNRALFVTCPEWRI
jgi:hypothetical protein